VADQLLGGLEPVDVADGGQEGGGRGQVDARHAEQPGAGRVGQGGLGDGGVEAVKLVTEEPELTQTGRDSFALVGGQLDGVEPAQSLHSEQIRRRGSVDFPSLALGARPVPKSRSEFGTSRQGGGGQATRRSPWSVNAT